jgi:hypothetical protein
MSKLSTLAILSAAAIAVLASQAQAGRPGAAALGCKIASKEFAGPVEIANTSGKTLGVGTVIVVKVKTVYGTETEVIHLKQAKAPGALIKGNNTYQNTTGGCTAISYPKAGGYVPPKGA